MARFTDAELERLKTEVSLVRLVEAAGVTLKKHGQDWLGRCPFHDDKTPSLVVSPGTNLWHCLGACQTGGSTLDWVMKTQGVSFRHACELLQADAGLAPVGDGEPVKRSSTKKLASPLAAEAGDPALLRSVVEYYHDTLKQSPEALAYLAARGLNHAELIERFKLGYANRTLGYRLPEKNRQAGAEIRGRLQALGILRESGHEHFNGSLVVPVIAGNGQITDIYGRKIRDDLRPGTAYHLYLPGPHAGVWNAEALAGSREVILCEALIDAMTFWVHGFRNVTASYGVSGFTAAHLAAFKTYGIERVLIAYDRDEAGNSAAAKLAEQLRAEGLACFRVQFPKGMDANEYALKMQPPAKALGLLIRKAEWMGNGAAPAITTQPDAVLPVVESRPAATAAAKEKTAPAKIPEAIPPLAAPAASDSLPAAVMPPAPASDVAATVSEQEVVLRFGEGESARRWRVRGLPKNLAVGVLKVNLMVSDGQAFHVDTLDLYSARARAVFVQQAAAELRLREELLKTELGRVLLKLEQLQDESIQQALEPKAPAVPELSEAEREAALALLRAPDLLARIQADFAACGVVGEAGNLLAGYLAATSRLLERPLAIVIQSSSAAGKSSLMDAVLALLPSEATVRYSALTGQALFYLGETNLKHKVLAIAEEEGATRASYALKLLQSDGELTIASTGSDANGNLVTREYRVEGPMALFMTTTAIDIDEELLNRCLVLSVDEGREQTRAIQARQRHKRTLAGLLAQEEKTAILTQHRQAQRLLRPLAVVNPYADRLTFLDDRTRTRRDHEKYLALIDTIALLHQCQRPIKTVSVGGRTVEYIEATLADITAANTLAHAILGRSLDELPPQTRRLLAELVPLVTVRAQAEGGARRDVRFTRRELRDALGWGDTQLKIHLARLVELELVLAHRQAHGLFVYELLYDGEAGTVPHLSGLIDPGQLRYDAERSGEGEVRSASGRGGVGAGSAPGRDGKIVANPQPVRLPDVSSETAPETSPRSLPGHGVSYPHAVGH